jgi:activating signal cointegrator 1
MKAISLHQPWASLMAVGAKKNETRGRRTYTYITGDVVICAAKQRKLPSVELCGWLWEHRHLFGMFRDFDELWNGLPFGHALCVVTFLDCVPSQVAVQSASEQEKLMGNYETGRFVWATGNLRKFKTPFPFRGFQGWFDVPDILVQKALQ